MQLFERCLREASDELFSIVLDHAVEMLCDGEDESSVGDRIYDMFCNSGEDRTEEELDTIDRAIDAAILNFNEEDE